MRSIASTEGCAGKQNSGVKGTNGSLRMTWKLFVSLKTYFAPAWLFECLRIIESSQLNSHGGHALLVVGLVIRVGTLETALWNLFTLYAAATWQ
jgi:hypothetical protein